MVLRILGCHFNLESVGLINSAPHSEQKLLVSFCSAEQDGHVAGFSMLAASHDEGWGEVLAISASPDHWGVGVGYELMAASVEWLQKQGSGLVIPCTPHGIATALLLFKSQKISG